MCLGYAKALMEVLACFGIQCEIVLNDKHAWNLVKLGDPYYVTDLTYDALSIKAKRGPLQYCLKSAKDYPGESSGVLSRPQEDIEALCTQSLPDEELIQLFPNCDIFDKPNVYFLDFLDAYAERGGNVSWLENARRKFLEIARDTIAILEELD